MASKTCSACGEDKPDYEFYAKRNQCKPCYRARAYGSRFVASGPAFDAWARQQREDLADELAARKNNSARFSGKRRTAQN